MANETTAQGGFPFSAIIGQEQLKKALLLLMINPDLGGLLISGEKGTGKSTLVRSLTGLLGEEALINVPLSITEDRLVGGLDLEAAIKGRKKLQRGLLHRAHGNILYVDEINLLNEEITNCLIETIATGVNQIQREGISQQYRVQYRLIGTMNPEEGVLRAQLLDRFGLYVEVKGEKNLENRAEIIRRRLEYENNPRDFIKRWQGAQDQLVKTIQRAKGHLKQVAVEEGALYQAATLAGEAGCQGHRGELMLIEAARALGAMELSRNVRQEHLSEAAEYVFPHRRTKSTTEEREKHSQSQGEGEKYRQTPENLNSSNQPEAKAGAKSSPTQGEKGITGESNKNRESPPEGQEPTKSLSMPTETTEAPIEGRTPVMITIPLGTRRKARGPGKTIRIKNDLPRGRYIKYQLPRGRITDIALDGTLKAAALQQRNRVPVEGQSLVIKADDLRIKLRRGKQGCVIVFLVDASGSMGAKRRMGAVKGTVLSMLQEAYQRRDRVGVIAFKGKEAQVLLEVTRSVDLAQKCLAHLPTGGKTPLAAGLMKAYDLLKALKAKEPDIMTYLVIVSDGKANVPLHSNEAIKDALFLAEKLKQEKIQFLVLDTETGFIQLQLAKALAEALKAQYVKLEEISSSKINAKVMDLIGKFR